MNYKLKLPVRDERDEQVDVMRWAAIMARRWPALELLYAIPNGGHRDIRVAARLKSEGVKAGVPDLHLPVSRHGFHGLWIEMKRSRGGSLSQSQKAWHKRLIDEGHRVEVCYGARQAIEILTGYLQGGIDATQRVR